MLREGIERSAYILRLFEIDRVKKIGKTWAKVLSMDKCDTATTKLAL
jgi:hypothetical protein